MNFLKEIICKCDKNLITYLKDMEFLPNITFKKLYSAKDLYDSNHKIFRELFHHTEQFLPIELQSDGEFLNVLSSMGFIRDICNKDVFIKCANEIEILSDNLSISNEALVQISENLLYYLYVNVESLGLDEEELLYIRFIPISKNFLKHPYKEHGKSLDESQIFECFNNLALNENFELCWTQKLFYSEKIEPRGAILNMYPSIIKYQHQIYGVDQDHKVPYLIPLKRFTGILNHCVEM